MRTVEGARDVLLEGQGTASVPGGLAFPARSGGYWLRGVKACRSGGFLLECAPPAAPR